MNRTRMIAIVLLTAWPILCLQTSAVNGKEPLGYDNSSLHFELPQAPHDAIVAANKGKQAFERLILTDQQAIELGFESKAEAADTNISLGQPFPLVIVNVEMLKKYKPNIPPKKIINFSKQYIFPIQTKTSNKTKSSITVVELTDPGSTQQAWKPIDWGKKGLILPLVEVRETYNDFNYSFVVWLPALSRYFIGVLKEKDFVIIPLYSEPNYGFLKGVPISATRAFEELVREAQSIPILKRGIKKG
jgi:hypothetical protein